MKKKRQGRILELIQEENIETQEELADRLSQEGFVVTQATVSRDIRELKLGKIPSGNGRQKYAVLSHDDAHLADKYIRVLKNGFISMDNAQNILVVKTVSGMAMAAAAALDSLELDAIVGCIAGDDTIMCAIRTDEQTEEVMQVISELIYGK